MEQLDQDVVNLAKAIREVESGGNFQAKGGSGEFGAYQWMPATWASHSKKFLGREVPFGQATPEEQNEVAYKAIKYYKDMGYNVGEIASQWNSGSRDAYLKGKSGTNAQGVNYNVANYAKKVATKYQEIKGGSGGGIMTHDTPTTPNPQGFNPTPFSGGQVTGPTVPPVQETAKNTGKNIAKTAGKGLVELGKGVVKGTGQIFNKAAAKIADPISRKLNIGNEGGEYIDKLNTPSNKTQKAGAFVGNTVLPVTAALTTGGAAASAAGVNVPALVKGAAGLVKKGVQATKTAGKYGLIFDAIANAGQGTKGILGKLRSFFD